MKIGKNSPEKILEEIVKLDPVEFLGVCKILGVDIYNTASAEIVEETDEGAKVIDERDDLKTPREFYDIWSDICDAVASMNRTRRRNLSTLVRAATKKEK